MQTHPTLHTRIHAGAHTSHAYPHTYIHLCTLTCTQADIYTHVYTPNTALTPIHIHVRTQATPIHIQPCTHRRGHAHKDMHMHRHVRTGRGLQGSCQGLPGAEEGAAGPRPPPWPGPCWRELGRGTPQAGNPESGPAPGGRPIPAAPPGDTSLPCSKGGGGLYGTS